MTRREDYQTTDLAGAALFERHNGIEPPPPSPVSPDDVAPMAGTDDVGESWFEQAMRERRWELT